MSSIIIAVYAVFCVSIFVFVNISMNRKKGVSIIEAHAEREAVKEAAAGQEPMLLEQEDSSSEQVLQSAATTALMEQAVEDVMEEVDAEKPSPAPKRTEKVRENVHTGEKPAANRALTLVILVIGMFVSLLNQTVIDTVVPTLINEFNVSATTAQWLTNGFMLVNGILVPISVYLVNTFTYRKLFLFAMLFFTAGSILCAAATNFSVMMTGRAIQAVGAGILMPIGSNIFLMLFPPGRRGVAMGLLGIALILAPAIGPTIAGWLIEHYTWNVMFYGMFILGLLIFFVAIRFFRLEQTLSKPRFDAIGAVASAIGLGTLLYGFSEAGSEGWDSAEVVSMLIVGTIGLIFFIVWELKAEKKLMDLTIFKIPAFSFTIVINVIITMSMFGGLLLLPIYLQNIRGFSAIDSGIILLPGSLLMGFMGPFAGRLFDRYGIRPLAVCGLLITTYCTYEFTHLSYDTPYSHIIGIYTLRSFGMSFLMMPMMTAGINSLKASQISDGTAAQSTLRSVAGSIGTAILITVMSRQSTFHAADYANEVTAANPVLYTSFTQNVQGLAAVAHVPAQTGATLETSLLYGQVMKISAIEGINDAFWVATIASAAALVLSLFLQSGKKRPAKK
ncbi:DHA2 family efflux MFS transporter permease subunit [Ectobacillus ponti]|uniref:DHA2 family efflux MFS transporter permease subunit n=1 Tax=Ectobacillus ponti TaxID=2961894 RepID=A0AA41X5G7_9BACI|nr:DHA2 family efflux MFS transporter permease subunit [Ectobacillus ponti]MCP8969269.1 DHA2 family efflux MFS transporter permease subunit [Ectobacillus ponti]